jgi:hypothetical protein
MVYRSVFQRFHKVKGQTYGDTRGYVIMDMYIIFILIFGIPAFFFSKRIVDYFKNRNSSEKVDDRVIYRYIIQLKDEAVGKVQPKDLSEIGRFDVYGTSGSGLQGTTNLKQDEFKDYLCSKFSLASNLITVIDPNRVTRRY